MVKLLLFCVLLVFCWPLAIAAVVMYPLVWLITLPFRLAGVAVTGALALVTALLLLPVRLVRAL
jgi:hypothetical protein